LFQKNIQIKRLLKNVQLLRLEFSGHKIKSDNLKLFVSSIALTLAEATNALMFDVRTITNRKKETPTGVSWRNQPDVAGLTTWYSSIRF
jgi:hypothetical protein